MSSGLGCVAEIDRDLPIDAYEAVDEEVEESLRCPFVLVLRSTNKVIRRDASGGYPYFPICMVDGETERYTKVHGHGP